MSGAGHDGMTLGEPRGVGGVGGAVWRVGKLVLALHGLRACQCCLRVFYRGS